MTTTGTKKPTPDDLEYFRERQKNRVYEVVYLKYADEAQKAGLTKAHIAQFLGKKPEQITRWLAGPGNWTLDTLSDLLLAMDAEMEFKVSDPLSERRDGNYAHPVAEMAASHLVEAKPEGARAEPRKAVASTTTASSEHEEFRLVIK